MSVQGEDGSNAPDAPRMTMAEPATVSSELYNREEMTYPQSELEVRKLEYAASLAQLSVEAADSPEFAEFYGWLTKYVPRKYEIDERLLPRHPAASLNGQTNYQDWKSFWLAHLEHLNEARLDHLQRRVIDKITLTLL
ncbi:hypothetical protein PVAG01_06493 [Phlyctema vagabunda]|uniref:Uncharacterized protein n=1 Tax=Phlyctema vagabunda TaxID=108571 RepID=A0ABR4PG83_9HELO